MTRNKVGSCFLDLYTAPGSTGRNDATAWPLKATEEELQGLPPHVIIVNELDTLRDEGLEISFLLYYVVQKELP